MKVICEIEVRNTEHLAVNPVGVAKLSGYIYLEGNPLSRNSLVTIRVDGKAYNINPNELSEALSRVRSDR